MGSFNASILFKTPPKAVVKGVPAGRAKIQYGEDQSEDDFPPHEIDDWFIQQDLEISNNNEN